MSDKFIKDEELDEIEALYAQKLNSSNNKKKNSSDKDTKVNDSSKEEKIAQKNNSNREESEKSVQKSEALDDSRLSSKKSVATKHDSDSKPKVTKVIKNNDKDDKASKKSDKPSKKPKKKALQPQDKPTSIVNVVLFGAVFVTSIVLLFVLERPTVSMTEKRPLAKFPEFSWDAYWSGKYTSDISNWFNDTVPFRDELKSIGAIFRSMFGISEGQIVGPSQKVESVETEVTTASTKPIQIVTPPPKTTNDNAETTTEPKPVDTATSAEAPISIPSDITVNVIKQNGDDVIYTTDNADGYQLYANLYSGDRKNVTLYNEALKQLKEQTGVDVYNMICPTQNTFLTPKELNKGKYTEQSDAAYLANNLDSSIKTVDVFAALTPHVSEDLYFARDKHWKQIAAYYAAQAFANEAGFELQPLSNFEKVVKQCYGCMYPLFRNYEFLLYSYEDFEYYKPQNEYSTEYLDEEGNFKFDYPYMPEPDYHEDSFYSLYGVADNHIHHITTDVENGKTLVIIKDDYMNNMVPFFIPSYSEIYLIDPRYTEIDIVEFIKEKNADEILVGMTASNALGAEGRQLAFNLGLSDESSETENSVEVSDEE